MNNGTNKVHVSYFEELPHSNFPNYTNSLTFPLLWAFSLTLAEYPEFPGCQKFWKSSNPKKHIHFLVHSAWSESSAARPRPRGGRRGSEKLAPGAFPTLQRRGPQGRAQIWVVFSCKDGERGEWRGPKGRADALDIVVLWRKDDRAARPVGPSRRVHFRRV